MREIKFRAWDGEKILDCENDGYGWTSRWPLNEMFKIGYLTFMQYTGLHDKNGREIYEGDILRDDEDKTNIGEVGFELGWFYCTAEMGTDFYKWAYRHAEVIGNIYENRELLEVK